MARAAELDVNFTTSGIDTVNKAVDGLNVKLGAIGAGLMVAGQQLTSRVTQPILGFFADMYTGAASFEQAVGKIEAVYGSAGSSIVKWSEDSAKSFGMSQTAALDMVGTYGMIMQAQGLAVGESEEYSKALIGLAADMSAFTDRDVSETSNALRAALTGEYESLKNMGIVLKAADVEQQALNIAMSEGRSEVTEADRVLARYNIIMEKTSQMHEQFARESEGASGSLATLKAEWQNLTVQLGDVLLPIGTKVTQLLSKVVTGLGKMPRPLRTAIVVVAALAAAMGPLLMLLGAMATGIAVLPGIFAALSAVLVPLIPVIAAVAVAVGALFLAYKTNFLGFGDMVDGAIGKMREFFAVPESKNVNLMMNTSLDDPEDLWSRWEILPDGTAKHMDLGITANIQDGRVEEVLDPETGEKTWLLHVDIDGDSNPDATRILDSRNQGDGKYVMTIEVNGEQYQAWYDEKSGETLVVPLDFDDRLAISKWDALKWKIENDGLFGTLGDGFLAMLQGASDASMKWLNEQGNAWEGRFLDALVAIGEIAGDVVRGIQGVAEAVVNAIVAVVDTAINTINGLIEWVNGLNIPGVNIGTIGEDDVTQGRSQRDPKWTSSPSFVEDNIGGRRLGDSVGNLLGMLLNPGSPNRDGILPGGYAPDGINALASSNMSYSSSSKNTESQNKRTTRSFEMLGEATRRFTDALPPITAYGGHGQRALRDVGDESTRTWRGLRDMFVSVAQGVDDTGIPAWQRYARAGVNNLRGMARDMGSEAANAARNVGDGLAGVGAVVAARTGLGNGAARAIARGNMIAMARDFGDMGRTAATNLGTGLKDIGSLVGSKTGNGPGGARAIANGNMTAMATNMGEKAGDAARKVGLGLLNLPTVVGARTGNGPGGARAIGVANMGAMASGMGTEAGKAPGKVRDALGGLGKAVSDQGGTAAGAGYNIGTAIADGAKNGINDRTWAVEARARAMALAALAAAKAALGIRSPSREFMKLFAYVPEGAALGIEQNTSVLQRAMEDMVSLPGDYALASPDVEGIAFSGRSGWGRNGGTTVIDNSVYITATTEELAMIKGDAARGRAFADERSNPAGAARYAGMRR